MRNVAILRFGGVSVTGVRTLSDRFRAHAEHSDHLYAALLRAMADDWDRGGVVREICRGWETAAPGAFVQLRLLAGLHRLVLTGQAPQLASFYPNLGGTADPALAWAAVQPVMSDHVADLQQALSIAPQTNEPGRSVALLVGIFDAVRRSGLSRIRLLEPGASAGLNLLVDRFRIGGTDPHTWWSGPESSPLVISDAVQGAVQPASYEIVERQGCDVSPIDPTSEEGRVRLTSFVWPHQLDRHRRLAAALEVARDHPVSVISSGAAEWLGRALAVAPDPGVLTIVWHSITRLYWPPEEVAAVSGIITSAAQRMPLAEVSMEYPLAEAGRRAELRVRVGGSAVLLGTVADHGVPVTMDARL